MDLQTVKLDLVNKTLENNQELEALLDNRLNEKVDDFVDAKLALKKVRKIYGL